MRVPVYVLTVKTEHPDAALIYDALNAGEWYSSKLAALATADQLSEQSQLYGNNVTYQVWPAYFEMSIDV